MTDSEDRRLTVELAEQMWEMVGYRSYCEWHGFWEEKCGIPKIVDNGQEVFHKFVKEYGIGRTISRGKREEVRCKIREHFPKFGKNLSSDNGKVSSCLTELAEKLSKKATNGRPFSLLTKVAAFGWPERFVAMDSFAKKGIRKSSEIYSCNSLKGPVDDIKSYWEGVVIVKNITEDTCRQAYKRSKTGNLCFEAFHNRIIDLYLMSLGGRFSHFSPEGRGLDGTCKELSIFHEYHPWRTVGERMTVS